MRIRIGHLSTFYHTAVILMADRKTPDRLGAEPEWKLFGTGPAMVEAFRRGELDLAYIGLPPAIIGIASGVPITCIAGGHMEGTVIIGGPEDHGMPETEDLFRILSQYRGRKIGVPGRGSIHDVILTDCLKSFRLAEEIEVVHFRWADQIIDEIIQGGIAAAFGTPALAVALKWYAGAKQLCPPRRLWPQNPSYGILVHRSFPEKEEDLVVRFLTLHERATSLLREDPVSAARIISRYVGFVDQAFVLETLNVSPCYCAQLTEGYIASTLRFIRTLRELGYTDRSPSRDEIFDLTWIRKVHGPGDHYGKRTP